MFNLQEKTFFSDIQQMWPLVIREEMRKQNLVRMDRDSVPTCKVFVRSIVVLFLGLYHMYQRYGAAAV